MNSSKPHPPSVPAIERVNTSSAQLRYSHRPTVSFQQFEETRIQEVILGVFRRFDYKAVDLDSLVYFTLQFFYVTPESYEVMHRVVRNHIIAHFAISQGKLKPPSDNSTRRLIVCYTIDKKQE